MVLRRAGTGRMRAADLAKGLAKRLVKGLARTGGAG